MSKYSPPHSPLHDLPEDFIYHCLGLRVVLEKGGGQECSLLLLFSLFGCASAECIPLAQHCFCAFPNDPFQIDCSWSLATKSALEEPPVKWGSNRLTLNVIDAAQFIATNEYFMGDEVTDEAREVVEKNFMSLPMAMLTMMQFVTFDNVVLLYRPLVEEDSQLTQISSDSCSSFSAINTDPGTSLRKKKRGTKRLH
eukprot:3870822-Amphidinium_carterae.1